MGGISELNSIRVLQLTSIRDECPLFPSRIKKGCCFFTERDRINSKLVCAVPKLNLIQKGTGGQSHHLPCPIRQIIAKIVCTLSPQELKLETLTIQNTKGFCCLIVGIVLLGRHCPSLEEDDSWQVEATDQRGLDVLDEICVDSNPLTPTTGAHRHIMMHHTWIKNRSCTLQFGHFPAVTLLHNLPEKYWKYIHFCYK